MSKKQFDEMAEEYDFSKGERGKFFRKEALLSSPVYLEPEILTFLQAKAQARGVTLGVLVNQLLKRTLS